MAEELNIIKGNREDIYQSLLPQLKALITGEDNLIANLANISAALRQSFGFFWVGFYIVDSDKELVLGPFQGDIACTRITLGKGVCGTSWKNNETIIVPDVDVFPGHIACSSSSKSEIVVPILKDKKVRLILDVDSEKLDDFNEIDKMYLERLSLIISSSLCD
jgi:L-methionine (R)-S-oxide reductase